MARDKKPRKGYLYTWNLGDGFLGEPKRKINLQKVKPALLWIAYLEGGPGWDSEGSGPGSFLCILLNASAQRQSSDNYYKFLGDYDLTGLEMAFPDSKVCKMSGGYHMSWEVEFPCSDWTVEEIDKTIERVLEWHYKEIKRVKEL